ncbi:hypothetical protein AB1Y20_020509 [Prymnesium parvum]|uniref:FAD-binding domain-containing protein n=1 Tax=Prymnesium parvum TaxID=97485 RepID=A0AB34JTW0_PRYPA
MITAWCCCSLSLNAQLMAPSHRMRAVVAGGGIGGLTLATALGAAGWEVDVVERTTNFRSFGGPIQLASNALATLQHLDPSLLEEVLASDCVRTGDRSNGLKVLATNDWLAEFDLSLPAVRRGLPLTVVVERPHLQRTLLKRLQHGSVRLGRSVERYELEENHTVSVSLDNGEQISCDVLVGADGIWSSVRAQMHHTPRMSATYSRYRVFAAVCECVPADVKRVGYKVHVDVNKYFVTCDVGGGRIQWYAFVAMDEEATIEEEPSALLSWLRDEFGMNTEAAELLEATQASMVEHRPVYDRPPDVWNGWVDGRVALLGDAAHPMMPNLGQGGCMAIESAAVLADELARVANPAQLPAALHRYQQRRLIRVAIVHGLSRAPAELLRWWPQDGRFLGLIPERYFFLVLQPFLSFFFPLQFDFLYAWSENEMRALARTVSSRNIYQPLGRVDKSDIRTE